MRYEELTIEGRNAVTEAFRSGKTIDKLFVLDGCQDGPVRTIIREAKKHDTIINYVAKERLDQMSETGKHQGVIAMAAAYEYAEVEDILALAAERGEAPFIFLLDNIEDPHNLGAIIRTANLAGAHGVIIPKNRAVGLTATVARTSAGALNYTPVARVTNLAKTIEESNKFANGDSSSFYQENTKTYRTQDQENDETGYKKTINVPAWLISIVAILTIALVIVVAFSLISFFAPVILAALMVALVYSLIKAWKRRY